MSQASGNVSGRGKINIPGEQPPGCAQIGLNILFYPAVGKYNFSTYLHYLLIYLFIFLKSTQCEIYWRYTTKFSYIFTIATEDQRINKSVVDRPFNFLLTVEKNQLRSMSKQQLIFHFHRCIIDLTLTVEHYSVNQHITYMFYFRSILWPASIRKKEEGNNWEGREGQEKETLVGRKGAREMYTH